MNTTDSTIENETTLALQASVRKWLDTNHQLLRQWRTRAATRRALLGLEDHQLADIGISSSEALREGSKPFWRE